MRAGITKAVVLLENVERPENQEYMRLQLYDEAGNPLNMSSGIQGPRGPQGVPGSIGPAGPQGPQGVQGAIGSPGPIGETGAVGPQGPVGVLGPKGDPGLTGSKGDTGAPGPQGQKGDKGDTGLVGPAGLQGPQGPKGDTGLPGPTGAVSTVPGPQGPVGPAGPQGPVGADSTVPGPQGPIGFIGPQGPAGPIGADSTIPGPQGPVGPAGPQGPVGADSTVPGPQGPAGPTGPQGPTGADSTVPGPQGPTGFIGPQGPKGDTGDTGVIGPAGIQGPQGPKGDTGLQGPKGDTGDPGPQGPAGQSAGKTIYFAPSMASDISGYKKLLTAPSPGAEQVLPIATPSMGVDVLVAAFATDPGALGAVDYPEGTGYRRFYASVNVGVARIRLQVYKRDAAGTETLIRDEYSDPFTGSTVAVQMWTASTPYAGTLLATDRIVSRISVQRYSGGGSGTVVTTYWEGTTHTSQIQTTISSGAQGATGPQGPAGPAGPTGPQGPAGAGALVQDEGVALTQRSAVNFVGAGVTATDDSANDRTTITIPGGGGGSGSARTARASRVTAQSIADVTFVPISFTTEDRDDGAMIDIASQPTRITIDQDGTYLPSLQIQWNTVAAAGRRIMQLRRFSSGGTQLDIFRNDDTGITTAVTTTQQLEVTFPAMVCLAGQYLVFEVYQQTGAAMNLSWGLATVVKVDGPVGPQGPAGGTPSLVSVLPSSPTEGQEVYFQNALMESQGVIWHLRYRGKNADASNNTNAAKWEVLGAPPPLWAEDGNTVTTPSATYVDLTAVSLVLPLAGDYTIDHGFSGNNTNINCYAYQDPNIGGATSALDEAFLQAYNNNAESTVHREVRRLGLASGATVKLQHRQSGGGTARYYRRYLAIRPIRVG